MMLERGAHSNWAKNGVIRDVFWEWIADRMPEESKIGEVFSDNWGYPLTTCKMQVVRGYPSEEL
jgi:hypothetical protein